MEYESPPIPPPTAAQRARRFLIAAALPGILSAGAALVSWLAAGPTLGLFFGGIAFAALLAPALLAGETTLPGRLAAGAGVLLGIALVWLAAVFSSDTTLPQWLACCSLLVSFLLALCGMTLALQRIGLSAVAAAALTTTLAIAWLTWPIYLAPVLHGSNSQRIVDLLVPAQPLFAINAAVTNLGLWSEQNVIYRLSNMNQDLAYPLPNGVHTGVIVHATIGIGLGMLALARRKRRPESLA